MEADADEFIVRINVYKNHGYFSPEDFQKTLDAVKEEKIVYPKEILSRFVEKYQK